MTTPVAAKADLAAIFAGGSATRMGGADKGAVLVGGEPLHRLVIRRLAPQADAIAILAPRAPDWLGNAPSALWLADAAEAKGPAAGLLSALRWLDAERGGEALLLTAPVDAPFLPPDLFEKLDAARREANAPAAIVRHAGGLHPVFGLWRADCAGAVEDALQADRALHRIATKIGAVACEAWPAAALDPFANLNTPEDVAAAEIRLRSQ